MFTACQRRILTATLLVLWAHGSTPSLHADDSDCAWDSYSSALKGLTSATAPQPIPEGWDSRGDYPIGWVSDADEIDADLWSERKIYTIERAVWSWDDKTRDIIWGDFLSIEPLPAGSLAISADLGLFLYPNMSDADITYGDYNKRVRDVETYEGHHPKIATNMRETTTVTKCISLELQDAEEKQIGTRVSFEVSAEVDEDHYDSWTIQYRIENEGESLVGVAMALGMSQLPHGFQGFKDSDNCDLSCPMNWINAGKSWEDEITIEGPPTRGTVLLTIRIPNEEETIMRTIARVYRG